MTNKNKIICAIDKAEMNQALGLISQIKNHVGMVKLGLEFFSQNGPAGVKKITQENIPIFLDLKLHDIANTVAASVRELTKIGVDILTIHASGGSEMIKAAVKAADEVSQQYKIKKPLIIAVTILTSLDDADLKQIGFTGAPEDMALKLARLAKESGADGVVCSAHEIKIMRENLPENFKIITPGIRTAEQISQQNINDQKRVLTPKDAVNLGADYLVIGRAISADSDHENGAKEILASLTD